MPGLLRLPTAHYSAVITAPWSAAGWSAVDPLRRWGLARVLLWDVEQLDAVGAVIERARSGGPVVVVIEGEPGTGKTALLDELLSRATGFQVHSAEALESDRVPYNVLTQWGVDVSGTAGGAPPEPFIAAQGLRMLADDAGEGALLLRLDDLQWADPESVEAVTWLLRRASGDRLLIAVGTRPLPARTHANWQRWLAGRGRSEHIRLTGLSAGRALSLMRQRRADVSVELTARLTEHTSGNPLYLTALMNDYDSDELARMRVLPAPAEFVHVLTARMKRLPEHSVDLLRAAAVLGSGWHSLPVVAGVSGTAMPTEAVQPLADSGFVQIRTLDSGVSVRTVHTLVTAAIYQQTPLGRRRALHARAAELASSEAVALEHRMAAAERYDDELAAAMENYAARLHRQRSHRLAAQFLDWSSVVTAGRAERERRWLECMFDTVLARDFAEVHRQHRAVDGSGDVARRALVLGALAVYERRLHEGIDVLEPIVRMAAGSADPLTRYRAGILLAWARLGAGQPTALIAEDLARLVKSEVEDVALSGFAVFCQGQVTVRRHGVEPMLDRLRMLPAAAAEVPQAATFQLAWRGSLRARLGLMAEAAEDLSEAVRRIQEGASDFGAGSFHAFLAHAQWMRGEWHRAQLNFRLAADIAGQFPHPLAVAMAPVVEVGFGRLSEADRLIDRAQTVLRQTPWQDGCELLLITQVVRLHARASAAERAVFLRSLDGTIYDAGETFRRSPVWLLHVALAAVWAQDLHHGEECVASLAHSSPQPGWAPAAVQWLLGLLAEARGKGRAALAHLGTAAADDSHDLPLYRAHMLVDQARLERLLGHHASADASLQAAEEMYGSLGAAGYLEGIARLRPSVPFVAPPARASGPAPTTLTEREQDVVTLVVGGMSYAQIAKSRFITRSTVGYHLGNIYAKVGVGSRHELAELARRNPALAAAGRKAAPAG